MSDLKLERDYLFEIAKQLFGALVPLRHINVDERPEVTYSLSIPGNKLADAKRAVSHFQTMLCLCGHQGPDREGEHLGAEIPAPSRRLGCTHPGCNCKGFGSLQDAVNFITDERFGGP